MLDKGINVMKMIFESKDEKLVITTKRPLTVAPRNPMELVQYEERDYIKLDRPKKYKPRGQIYIAHHAPTLTDEKFHMIEDAEEWLNEMDDDLPVNFNWKKVTTRSYIMHAETDGTIEDNVIFPKYVPVRTI